MGSKRCRQEQGVCLGSDLAPKTHYTTVGSSLRTAKAVLQRRRRRHLHRPSVWGSPTAFEPFLVLGLSAFGYSG